MNGSLFNPQFHELGDPNHFWQIVLLDGVDCAEPQDSVEHQVTAAVEQTVSRWLLEDPLKK